MFVDFGLKKKVRDACVLVDVFVEMDVISCGFFFGRI